MGSIAKAIRVTAKLTSKGQITIPATIRRRFGLKTGDSLAFVETDGLLRVEPMQPDVSVFERWRGIGNPGLPSGRENIVRYFRELRGHDDID